MGPLPTPVATAVHPARGTGWIVVLPALNESASVAGVIAEVHEAVPGAEVVVVDDGSTDATAAVARAAGARVLELPFNIGVGAAVRAGLLLARRRGVEVVVQCDADGQHPADAIAALVAGLAGADLVVGARWAGTGEYDARGPRRWAMVLLAQVLTAVHGTRLDDVTSGFRAFGPRAIEVLSREMPPEYLGDTLDALVLAKIRGLRVVQVPVAFRTRAEGVPSHTPVRSAFYLVRATLVLAVSLLRLAAPHRRAAVGSGAGAGRA
jgi:glycosyltransferase involved in cell wall biosynthesis